MKHPIKLLIGLFLVSLAISSCSASGSVGPRTTKTNARSSSAKSLPPGQAKKISGEKSARNHAPGRN